MLFNLPIHRQIEIGFLCGIRQYLRVKGFPIDFGNSFRNPAFALITEPLAFGLNCLLVTRLDALIRILILRNAVLPLRGQGGFAFN